MATLKQRIEALVSSATQIAAPMGATAIAVSGSRTVDVLAAGASSALAIYAARVGDRQAEVLTRAATNADVSAEVLLLALDTSPEKQELLVEAYEAARTATLEAKRVALGAALASGAASSEGGGGVTRELMIVRAIADLDSPHIHLLNQINGPAPGDPIRSWTLQELCFASPHIADVIEPLLVVLERHALVSQHEGGGVSQSNSLIDREWTVTTHGQRLLERIAGQPATEDALA